jgi:cation-transporting ATPase 13A3/4/5
VLVVEAKMTVPCDCLILTGELMMNEASLTGESVPIAKEGLQNVFE